MKIILMIVFSFFVPFIYYYKDEKRVPWNEVTTCAVLIFIFLSYTFLLPPSSDDEDRYRSTSFRR
jgi:hypothetical protein